MPAVARAPLAVALPLLLVLEVAVPRSARAAEVFAGRPCMGTVLEITVEARSEARARALLAEAFREADRLEAILSDWRPHTELSRFNARAGRGPVPVSPELGEVLSRSRALHDATRGTFDVTLGPVILLQRRGAPAREALALVDGRGLAVKGRWAALARRGMAVDLGGIGKGYAADRLRDLLVRGGAHSGFIDFGQSSQLAFGPRPRTVAVRTLSGRPGPRVTLRDMALSTSDSGLSESSVLDPRTGLPVPARRQATVLSPSATDAEGWTKALIVLGRGCPAVPGRVVYQEP